MIALGRAMLALLFLLSIWLDSVHAAREPARTYPLLLVYVAYALVLGAATWRNWWLDARLAAPAHAVDMAIFTVIVFSTNPDTSPFFLFFILPLLSAAIRWGWRETALTATALVLLYLTAGILVSSTHAFEMQRFIVRSGDLVMLSAVLIWFGMHQQFARLFFRVDELDRRIARGEDPIPQALEIAMEAAGAGAGALLVESADGRGFAGIRLTGARADIVRVERPITHEAAPVILFDLAHRRALTMRSDGWYGFSRPSKLLDGDALQEVGAGEGLVADVRTGTRRGWLVLWEVADLSVDYLEVGVELGRLAGAVLDRDALFSAIEEGAAARTRLSLARDVHDSVVQFLAGAAFRVEAIMRASRSGGGQVEADLKELKRLLIEEQGEIRAFVAALRRHRELELTEAVEELRTLALRLGQQWSVDCRVGASNDDASIPMRLQLDMQQLLREAVANAVRHGGASRIEVDVGVDEHQLRLQVKDNGSGFGSASGLPVQPWSLKERVDRAHGSLSLESEPGCTNLLITLPLLGTSL